MRLSLLGSLVVVLACAAEPAPQPPVASSEAGATPDGTAPAPRRTGSVWYADWRPEPTSAFVAGMPLSAVDSSWASAIALEEVPLPADAYTSTVQMTESGARFLVEDDLNADGVAERAVVGVFRTVAGEEGRFLVIFQRDSVETWRKVFLSTMPELGFSALTQPRTGSIVWAACLSCDSSTEVTWDGTKYDASFQSCCEDDDPPGPTDSARDSIAVHDRQSRQAAG